MGLGLGFFLHFTLILIRIPACCSKSSCTKLAAWAVLGFQDLLSCQSPHQPNRNNQFDECCMAHSSAMQICRPQRCNISGSSSPSGNLLACSTSGIDIAFTFPASAALWFRMSLCL